MPNHIKNVVFFDGDPELIKQMRLEVGGYDPDGHGTYTMRCQYSGQSYYNISLSQVMEICKYSANIPDTPEGEVRILNWARDRGII